MLADRGFLTKRLQTYSQFGSDFIGHPNRAIPGIEMNTGIGTWSIYWCWIAIAGKMDNKVIVFCSYGGW